VSFTQPKNGNDLYTALIKPHFFMCVQSLVLTAEEFVIYLLKQFCSWHGVAPDERLTFACLKFSEGNVSTEMYFTSEAAKQ